MCNHKKVHEDCMDCWCPPGKTLTGQLKRYTPEDIFELEQKAANWDRVLKAKKVNLYFDAVGGYIEIYKNDEAIGLQMGTKTWPENGEYFNSLEAAMQKLIEVGL